MTPVYKTTDDLLSDYNSLPEIEQNRVGKYLKNLVRIHKAIASLNFADRQVNWELSKQRIEPYTEAEEIKSSCLWYGVAVGAAFSAPLRRKAANSSGFMFMLRTS